MHVGIGFLLSSSWNGTMRLSRGKHNAKDNVDENEINGRAETKHVLVGSACSLRLQSEEASHALTAVTLSNQTMTI
jgi:hypothetical protein